MSHESDRKERLEHAQKMVTFYHDRTSETFRCEDCLRDIPIRFYVDNYSEDCGMVCIGCLSVRLNISASIIESQSRRTSTKNSSSGESADVGTKKERD